MLQIAADAAGTIWSESVIELQTKVREDFTITEKAPTMDADAKVMRDGSMIVKSSKTFV